ncbi:unnamed protein product [Ixodes persulcatus]
MGPVRKFVPQLTSIVDTANKFICASPQNCVLESKTSPSRADNLAITLLCLVRRNARTSHGSEAPDCKDALGAFSSTTGSTAQFPEPATLQNASTPGINYFVLRRRDRVASAVLNAVCGSYSSLDEVSQYRWHRV